VTHVRRQIRDLAVSTALGLPTTGTRVFNARLYPLGQADLPCWIVSTDEGETSDQMTLPGRQDRSLTLTFSGYARADVFATLDTMAEELEAVILPSAFRAVAKDVTLTETAFESSVDELDNQFGAIVLTYTVRYHTIRGAPGVAV
jgi:hypothetical protein